MLCIHKLIASHCRCRADGDLRFVIRLLVNYDWTCRFKSEPFPQVRNLANTTRRRCRRPIDKVLFPLDVAHAYQGGDVLPGKIAVDLNVWAYGQPHQQHGEASNRARNGSFSQRSSRAEGEREKKIYLHRAYWCEAARREQIFS